MTDANPQSSSSDPAASTPPGYPGAPAPLPPAQPGYESNPYGQPAYPQQQQPYGYGAAPYGYPAAPKTNTLAIVSLISSIAAFVVLPFIASVVAVITGHMSLKQLKTSGEAGRGMALAGTIVGWVGIGLAIIGTVLVVLWVIFVVNIASTSSYSSYS